MLQENKVKPKGFTLIELLIVIGILAVLSTAAVLMLNPADMLAQTRDNTRLTDLNTINQALNFYQYYVPSPTFGAVSTVYISIPSASADCGYSTGNPLGLPSIPAGWSYVCKDSTNYRLINGNGWIPVDFTQISGGSPLATLPIDPINSVSQGLYYSYIGGSWTVNSMLESAKYLSANARTDGGIYNARYEMGPNISLWSAASGLVGYWRMDESSWNNNCSTNTVMDSSQNANHGKSCPNGTGPLGGAVGKVGNAGNFDATNKYIDAGNTASLKVDDKSFTLEAWVRPAAGIPTGGRYTIMALYSPGWIMDLPDDGGVEGFRFYNGSIPYKYNIPGGSLPLEWTHFAVTRDLPTNKLRIYVNGDLKQTWDMASVVSSVNPLLIGKRTDGYYFNGTIDEIKIYNRALSATEVKALYNATK